MSKEPDKLGQIIIDIYPGGVKKATFKGDVGHNDVFSSKVTLQRDYMVYLNDLHTKHEREAIEAKRVDLEKKALMDAKVLKIKQEKEKAELDKIAKKERLEADIAELKLSLLDDMNDTVREIKKKKLDKLKKDLLHLSK